MCLVLKKEEGIGVWCMRSTRIGRRNERTGGFIYMYERRVM